MPSSISSSERPVPRLAWGRLLGAAFAIFATFVATMELRLAARGFVPAVADSESLWRRERERASDLGSRALALIGASRMQLGMDLPTLRRVTGLEPVQLAIDGGSFVPVLEGLARDEHFRGSVLVSYTDAPLVSSQPDVATGFENRYERRTARRWDFERSEAALGDLLRSHLRSYANGARPLTSLLLRILRPGATPQYLVTLPDRSGLADYRRVPMPEFYYGRTLRTLGHDGALPEGLALEQIDAALRAEIATVKPSGDGEFVARSEHVKQLVQTIRSRGGDVAFAVFPTSGFVREIEDRTYPRERFWNRFATSIGAPTLHFTDDPSLSGITCPDGSHLDFRDRPRFSYALAIALELGKANRHSDSTTR